MSETFGEGPGAQETAGLSEALRVMGRAYADGRLSVGEVAVAVAVSAPDTVELLQKHGFVRPPEAQLLSNEQLGAALKRLRDERLRRGGAPFISNELLARDLIATERIEGVDVRSWTSSR